MQTSDFDYTLPDELIAQHPSPERDESRLMVLRRSERTWEHRRFSDLPELLSAGDLLVRNDSRVIPARLIGRRESTGGRWEGLFLREQAPGCWEVLARTRGKPAEGERIEVGKGLVLELWHKGDGGRWLVRVGDPRPVETVLNEHGAIPLPPYIRKGREGPGDRGRYQTLYASHPGSVAAPTAGLHFNDRTFDALERRGVDWADLTLHVGIGTFRPIESDRVEDHPIHSEWASLSAATADRINQARRRGGRIVAVGTTSTRVLESIADDRGLVRPYSGEVSLYIKPGHQFRGIDAMVTNFHLPRSSLLVLVSALVGRDDLLAAYEEAVRERYRFYSYGDAMLIL